MTTDPSMSHRVTRLENDTESIYELITHVRSAQDEHTHRLDRIDNTLTEVKSAQDEHTHRLDRIDNTLTEVVRRLPAP